MALTIHTDDLFWARCGEDGPWTRGEIAAPSEHLSYFEQKFHIGEIIYLLRFGSKEWQRSKGLDPVVENNYFLSVYGGEKLVGSKFLQYCDFVACMLLVDTRKRQDHEFGDNAIPVCDWMMLHKQEHDDTRMPYWLFRGMPEKGRYTEHIVHFLDQVMSRSRWYVAYV